MHLPGDGRVPVAMAPAYAGDERDQEGSLAG